MMTRSDAYDIAHRVGVPTHADFHTFGASTVERILIEADARRYRKPKNANGSRARMFWQYVQRRAAP